MNKWFVHIKVTHLKTNFYLCSKLELNTILNLMTTYNLTADELLLIYLTFLARDEENHPEYFVKWFSNGGQTRLKSLFDSLKEKGIIHKNYNPDSYNPNDIEFNKTFLKSWIKNSGQMGQELFDLYPSYMQANGKLLPLRGISKQFHSLDEFFFHYSVTIGHSIEKHKEVLKILEWAKQNHKITGGILDFVNSRQWDNLKYLQEHGMEGIEESTFNVYESI